MRVNGRFELNIAARAGRQHVPYTRHHLRAAHAMLNPPLRELNVVLVNDAEMSRLHERFMNLAGPTDVLTFPIDIDARGRAISGEVIVCVPEARRRARELGHAVENELLLYALHGLLHLCGFDDRTARAYQRMHRMEDTILSRLGVGPIFRPRRRKVHSKRPRGARGSRAAARAAR